MRHEEVAVFAAGAEAHLAEDLTVCARSEPHDLHLSCSGQTPFPSGVPSAGIELRRNATATIGPFAEMLLTSFDGVQLDGFEALGACADIGLVEWIVPRSRTAART